MKEVLFITGNDDKFREFSELIKIKIKRKDLDLPELQGTPEEIVKEKAKLASSITKKTCIVDDTSLCFDEWGGLPGPYIKDFIAKMGVFKLAKTLSTSNNLKAKAITSIGYCEFGKNPVCIQGITFGKISLPKGNKNFKKGWDSIFIPNGSTKTNGEMESYEKHKFSQRKKAILKFESFLENRHIQKSE